MMTTMKTTILAMVLIMGTLFTSCDSDDPPVEEPTAQDSIIGVWKVTAVYVDGELDESDECDLKALFTFAKDGVASKEDYELATDETTCELVETDTTTWSKNSDGTYTIDEKTIAITFSNNNNTFEHSQSVGEGEEIEITKYVYTRQ